MCWQILAQHRVTSSEQSVELNVPLDTVMYLENQAKSVKAKLHYQYANTEVSNQMTKG